MTTRRDFLTVSLVATGAALAPRLAGAAGKATTKSLTTVRESSFIKAFDDYFVKTLAPEYEKLTGIKVGYEAVSVGGMLTRLTTMAETKSGPEIVHTGINWPHLFDQSLVDVSDLAGEVGRKLGGWHEQGQEVVDVNNNKAFLGEQISCTNNASSILVVAKRDFPEIAKVTDHALNPNGPKGRYHVLNAQGLGIMTYAPDQAAAKAFLRWLYDDKQMSRWLTAGDAYYAPFLHGYDNHPMWNAEPRYMPYKESLKTSRPHAWPGPVGHAASENVAKYVLVDMFAKACRGDATKDVIATAAAQLKQIYKAK